MSSKNETDRLRFPSGLSVRQAKANAKKLRKEAGLPLHDAQRKIASKNGLDMNHAKDPGQGSIGPCVRLESQGLTELEIGWFKTLPHVTELLHELYLRGRKYGVRFTQLHAEEGDPKITIILDLAGCSVEQEAAALLVPHLREALTAVTKASQETNLRFGIDAITRGRDMRFRRHQVQSIYDLLTCGTSIEKLAEITGNGEVIKLESRKVVPIRPPLFAYSGVKRTAGGFELQFLKSGKDHITHKLTSDAFCALADIAKLMTEAEGTYCLTLPGERQLSELRKLAVLELDGRGRVQDPPTLSAFGIELIRGCMDIQHDLYTGARDG